MIRRRADQELDPIKPVSRLLTLVGERNDDRLAFEEPVDDNEGEARQKDAPSAGRSRTAHLRIGDEKGAYTVEIGQELRAETGGLAFEYWIAR